MVWKKLIAGIYYRPMTHKFLRENSKQLKSDYAFANIQNVNRLYVRRKDE